MKHATMQKKKLRGKKKHTITSKELKRKQEKRQENVAEYSSIYLDCLLKSTGFKRHHPDGMEQITFEGVDHGGIKPPQHAPRKARSNA
jgi:hypothetical protein